MYIFRTIMETESLIRELKRYTVGIMDYQNNIVGTGVIVTDELVVTSYHVVFPLKNSNVVFSQSTTIMRSEVLREHSNRSFDIAFLRLNETLPLVASIAPLSKTITFGHDFISYGFRKPSKFDGLLSIGKIYGETIHKNRKGRLIQLYSDEIEQGMAGSPVLDLQTNRVIGIIASSFKASSNMDVNLSFAIPVQTMTEVCPIIGEGNSSNKSVSEFKGNRFRRQQTISTH
jgi:Trypsin-like peptidase domain